MSSKDLKTMFRESNPGLFSLIPERVWIWLEGSTTMPTPEEVKKQLFKWGVVADAVTRLYELYKGDYDRRTAARRLAGSVPGAGDGGGYMKKSKKKKKSKRKKKSKKKKKKSKRNKK